MSLSEKTLRLVIDQAKRELLAKEQENRERVWHRLHRKGLGAEFKPLFELIYQEAYWAGAQEATCQDFRAHFC